MNNSLFAEATKSRFWSFVEQGNQNDCWPWKARTNANGYGVFKVQSRPKTASRVALSYKLNRELQSGEYALHDCDNKRCCNPQHLHVGTSAQNTREAVERGRMNRWNGRRKGERNPFAKINQNIADNIRRAVGTNVAVAAQFSVSPALVSAIKNGKAWANG